MARTGVPALVTEALALRWPHAAAAVNDVTTGAARPWYDICRPGRLCSPVVTLLISTVLAIAAYFIKNEVLDPLRAFWGARWKAATVLTIHENILVNIEAFAGSGSVPETVWAAKDDTRHMAAELAHAYAQIPLRALLARVRFTTPPQRVDRAVAQLIGLSNSPHADENRDRTAGIRQALDIGAH